jgi:transcriptional regulator of acetoin/glycerol metabolism
MLEYEWPGNIRELKAVIERAAILAENGIIQTEDLMFVNN